MNIIFMRHGEATDNVKGVYSDKEIYWSVLTEKGKNVVKETIKTLPQKIDKIYFSPLPRTIETAHLVYEERKQAKTILDNRIREIDYGSYSNKPNDEKLDEVRKKQAGGDYEIRFGETGENRIEVEDRLSKFFEDVRKNNSDDATVLIVSHGTVMSFMKRMLHLEKSRLEPGSAEVYTNVTIPTLYEMERDIMAGIGTGVLKKYEKAFRELAK